MMFKKREVESALERKGFERRENDHSFFIYHTNSGQKTSVWTKTSHGSGGGDLDDSLISSMAKQCRINAQYFKDLIECPLSRQKYEEMLVNEGHIRPR